MAIQAVPGYGGQAARNTTGAPASIDSPLTMTYRPPRVGGGLNGNIAGPTTPIGSPSLGGVGIGAGGSAGLGAQSAVSPLGMYQQEIGDYTTGAQGMFGAQTSNLAAARADAIQRAIIGAGWDPSSHFGGSLASYSGDVTPQTLAAAAANPMSQKAQLDLQLNQANQNQPYDLAASGMGRSGAAAINQGNLQRQYQSQSYQGMQGLLDQIYGAGNTYAGGYNNALQQLEAARSQAAYMLSQTQGYSQPVSGDQTDPNAGAAPPGDSSQLSFSAPPTTNQKVQQVIASLGIKPGSKVNNNLYQNIRNIQAG